MSFTLIDQGSENFEFKSSVWSWKAAIEIIKSLDVVSEGKVRQMAYNATGVSVDQIEANEIGKRLKEEVMPKVGDGMRMFADLSVTEAPDDGTIYRDEDEKYKNYSVDREWLNEFSDFCSRCKGFQIF